MNDTLVMQVSVRGQVLKTYNFSKPLVRIGRSADSDVILDHPSVSREHVEIVRKDGGFLLRDCGSSNKTFLNGKRCMTTDLVDGDKLQVGRYFISVGMASENLQDTPRDRRLYEYPTVRVSVPFNEPHA